MTRDEHRQRDVVHGADAEPRHHEVLEDEHAGPDFGDAGQVAGEGGGRRGTDADDRRRQTRSAQPTRQRSTTAARSCSAIAVMASVERQSYEPPACVITPRSAAPPVSARPTATRSAPPGFTPAAVVVRVDLDERRDAASSRAAVGARPPRPPRRCRGSPSRRSRARGDPPRAGASRERCRRRRGCRSTPCAKNCSASFSVETVIGPLGRRHHPPRDLDALAGLHVRAEADAKPGHAGAHPLDVPVHAAFVEHERGRGRCRSRSCAPCYTDSCRTPRGGPHERPEITPSNLNRVVPA